MPKRMRTALALGFCTMCVVSAASAGRDGPLTTAELLVDLARDYGLSQRGQQTTADVQHVRALLQAAVRLDPHQAEAHTLLYELAMLDGDEAAAGRWLAGLLDAAPTNQGAFALWLAAGLRVQQTTEQRGAWLEAVAAQRPPAQRALVHVELARLALERLDKSAADDHLERAFGLEPACLEAAALVLAGLAEDADAERLRATLRYVQLCPRAIEAAWQAALMLDEYGFAEPAGRLFDHVRDLHHRVAVRGAVSGRFLLDMAHNRFALDDADQAVELARQAMAADPQVAAEAGMYLYYLLKRGGRRADARAVGAQLAERFAALREPAEWPVNEVAQAAWFYCTITPQPQRAAMLAQAAASRAPGDPFVQRVLGWAQTLNLQTEDALRTLRPLVAEDAYAAYVVAKLLQESGDAVGALQAARAADPPPQPGPDFDLLQTLNLPIATTQPAAERYPRLAKAWAQFDQRVLEFYQDPSRFLEPRVSMLDKSPAPGQPWRATFSLANRGPFPITLGPDAMVNPVFLVSYELEGDRKRKYPALLTVSVDHARVLRPGQTVQVERTLDVGPPRHVSEQTPQQLQRVVLNVLLDAEKGPDGQWRASLGGQQLRPVYFNRRPAVTGREALSALFSALAGDSQVDRVRAITVLAQLLGERQRAEFGHLNYEPQAVPAERMHAALLNLLSSAAWEVRVRTLEALQVVGLDRQMVDAVNNCLEPPHWLVRLMAVRVLARQGASFAERARDIAGYDTDELVRAVADSYVKRWSAEK